MIHDSASTPESNRQGFKVTLNINFRTKKFLRDASFGKEPKRIGLEINTLIYGII